MLVRVWKPWYSMGESESEVVQSCPTLCNPTDYHLSGSSVLGVFQARVLDWIAKKLVQPLLAQYGSFSKVSSYYMF